jgi:hypothetical protein
MICAGKPPDPIVFITLHFLAGQVTDYRIRKLHIDCKQSIQHALSTVIIPLSSYWLHQDAKHCHVLVTRLGVWIRNWSY